MILVLLWQNLIFAISRKTNFSFTFIAILIVSSFSFAQKEGKT